MRHSDSSSMDQSFTEELEPYVLERDECAALSRTASHHSLYPDQEVVNILSHPESGKQSSPCYEVTLEATETTHPLMLPVWRKWLIVLTLALVGLDICLLSSCWSLVSPLQQKYGVSHELFVLGVSFYIFGMAWGPLFLSPISEFYGRKLTYIIGLLLSIVFQILMCFVPNYGFLIFCRFMSGLFGSVFLSVAPGTISDIFTKQTIGTPLSIYSLCPFLGPSLGPLLAGIVVQFGKQKYMWTFYSLLIFSAFLFVLMVIVIPETYVPILTKRKAKALRLETGIDDYYAPLEHSANSLIHTILKAPQRPLSVLLFDPMMSVLCFYSGLVLGIVYLFFFSVPYTFHKVWGFNVAEQGLAFLGMTVGMVASSAVSPYFGTIYHKLSEKHGRPEPEYRFPPLIVGGMLAPASLITMAFTTYKQCHWIGALIASGFYGMSTGLIISGIFTYTTDAYRLFAASAAAANTFTRCSMAGIFPLFGLQMYEKLGVNYACLLLAMLALLLAPAPLFFYKFGSKLRQRSKLEVVNVRLSNRLVLLWLVDNNGVRKSLWSLSVGSWVLHNLDLDTQNTLSKQNVSGSNINEVNDWLTRVDHETVTELHRLSSSTLGLTRDDDLDTLSTGLHHVSDNTVSGSSNSKTVQQLVPERLTLSNGGKTSVLDSLGEQDDGTWSKLESLLDKRSKLVDSSTLLTKDSLGVGGRDDDLGLGWGDSNLDTGVSLFWEFSAEEFVQLGVEDTVSNKLSFLGEVGNHFDDRIVCEVKNLAEIKF
ncbi:hypothetical protein OGAPHI_002567 [Ogataea philodendri]|uniref:Major facilitator superfamily (MFS) profile domain-containing protein n=1 Tax=Ogataea philodendri TaxID=1378263 RepID=A0A9P8PBH8_9ASCO|nr:uncharacterized protein OGAPHI_002567 [Ogataea philodendri]KAH3668812.1 hypothetical protein OGAPHI_002567 [Ogataea philodendri]